MGPDGNLWFTEVSSTNAIGRIDLTGPRVTSVVAVAHRGKAIASILVGFNEALDPASATEVGFYSVAPGVERRHKLVFRKGVKIQRVLYDATAQAVRLKLAVPRKGPIRVTVRAGIMAADGMSGASDFTAVVTYGHGLPGSGGPDPPRREAALAAEHVRAAARSGRFLAPLPAGGLNGEGLSGGLTGVRLWRQIAHL